MIHLEGHCSGVGVVAEVNWCTLPAWASVLSDDADASTREQRFRRWLNNSKINVRCFYQPFIIRALTD